MAVLSPGRAQPGQGHLCQTAPIFDETSDFLLVAELLHALLDLRVWEVICHVEDCAVRP